LVGFGCFLRIIKEKIPLRNGKFTNNPYYMNPCRYYLWSHDEEPPEDEINSLVYFTAEFRCSSEPDESLKFKSAIETAKNISEQVLKSVLHGAGEFSANSSMINEGLSSPPNERFADLIGSYAMSEYLQKLQLLEDRRGKFLASISWLCPQPSLRSHYPRESLIEADYFTDSHLDSINRFKEILAEPLRQSLRCEKDFDFEECRLPL
jgi:hypothetical protein